MSEDYDYVIVGAGSAGCTLASRLTEDPSARVLLIEAGGWDRDPWIRIPLGWGKIFGERRHDWMYFTEPEPTLDGRSVECARGKVIGGSSTINAMAYVRGHRADYDQWAARGLTTWSYAHVLPYFRRQESWEGGSDTYRGGAGPLTTITSRYADPLVDAYLEAGQTVGYGLTPDYNGATQEGFGRLQSTIRSGRRCSAADAYLRPALRRNNLSIETNALATRIVFEGDRAVGLEYVKSAQTRVARASREVIIAAGAINTPQLLMLSGIGDPDELRVHAIDIKAPLKGVGRNLRDHFSVGLEYLRRGPGPFHRVMRLDRITRELCKAYLFGTGFATDLPSGWTAFVKSSAEEPVPDIQLLFRAVPALVEPYLPPFVPPFVDGFACRAVLVRPESRGSVKLASADPRTAVHISQNPLSTDADRRRLRDGVRFAFDLGRQASVTPFISQTVSPVTNRSSDDDLDAFIRGSAQTAHHPMGTCKMGMASDEMAVVDMCLRVHGVRALRVVDASIIPDSIGGNINGPVIMIAEKAADLIRARPTLAPADLNGRSSGVRAELP